MRILIMKNMRFPHQQHCQCCKIYQSTRTYSSLNNDYNVRIEHEVNREAFLMFFN